MADRQMYPTSAQERWKTCPNCGNLIMSRPYEFCDRCGASVSETELSQILRDIASHVFVPYQLERLLDRQRSGESIDWEEFRKADDTVAWRHGEVFEKIIDHYPELVTFVDPLESRTLLHAVSRSGLKAISGQTVRSSADAARLIISRGADVAARDEHGDSPLHVAVLSLTSHLGSRFGAKPSSTEVLMQPQYHVIGVLLDRGADPNAVNNAGRSALHVACGYGGSVLIVTKLLDFGADPNLGTTPTDSPLVQALAYENTEVARLLIRHGADEAHAREVVRRNQAEWEEDQRLKGLVCAACGKVLQGDWQFCPLCGTRFESQQTEPTG